MRRRYKRDHYKSRVEKIKAVMPHACIGVDVIVGFPNETEDDFKETFNFINSLNISYLHVFTYSERANTAAIDMVEGIVPMKIRRERNEMLRILSEKKRRAFYSEFLGQTRPVLFENHKNSKLLTGFTDNYIKIEVEKPIDVTASEAWQEGLVNWILPVELGDFNEEGDVKAKLNLNYEILSV